jgi:hypothetical protein
MEAGRPLTRARLGAGGDMARLIVERIGGLAGFGLPQSRLRSRGEMNLDALDAAQRQKLEDLFTAAHDLHRSPAPDRDAFVYVLSRERPEGTETIRLPERAVPAFISACVVDELL